MTVTTTTSSVSYTGSGLTYAYPFRILEDSDLTVKVAGVTKTIVTDYTVTGAGDAGGGNVVLVSDPGSSTVLITRTVPFTQTTDYVAGDSFPAETHETALDKLTMLCQQLNARITAGGL